MRGLLLIKRILAPTIFVTLLALALMSSNVVAAPIIQHLHSTFDTTFQADPCGIDGTIVEHDMIELQAYADGTLRFEIHSAQVFTSGATGKSVESFSSQQQTNVSPPIVNGDGTTTLLFMFKGLEQKLKIPDGPTLMRDAGPITFALTFDANGSLISQLIAGEKGPHPLADSGFALFCDVLVPAVS
jgi:hypothetical protein